MGQIHERIREKYNTFGDFLSSIIKKFFKKTPVMLLIDEYDKPVNDCLKHYTNAGKAKELLEGLKENFYRYLKNIPAVTVITGINKLSMSSFFSDFNNLRDYSNFINV